MADENQDTDGGRFYVTRVSAGAVAGLILFLGVVILNQSKQLDAAQYMMELLAMKQQNLQAQIDGKKK